MQSPMLQEPKDPQSASNFHRHIKPLGDFHQSELTTALMRRCGAYLERLNDPQRIALFYLSGAMISDRMKRKHFKGGTAKDDKSLVCDAVIFSIIPSDIGQVLETMSGAELTGVISCILENTHRQLWSSCDDWMPN